ncbi:Uu.00g055190.m01.CDS01 [Anthostomella pinea]|uniref:Uu.00g055190.m01.CDS01 n=1 Tax=Anthostomella pinea TaxID=933095 RepID=A0AAI8VWS4_9PEZI|nr:Uu.00g055190.m01.CDS01 [Anthostomella pinea]
MTRERAETMTASEKSLARLWTVVNKELERKDSISLLLRAILARAKPLRTIWKPKEATPATAPKSTTLQSTVFPEEKKKTRWLPCTKEAAEHHGTSDNGEEAEQRISVDRRAYNILRILLDSPGETRWTELLYTMTKIGFSVQNLGGSIWEFIAVADLGLARGIHFHDLDPANKVSIRKVRRHGKRMNRVYGWTPDSFREV